MNQYDEIFEWQMNPQEARVFKLARIWEDQTRQMFPDMQGLARLPRKGDPRKSNLFHYCWKLARETRGLLREEEYKLFIIANLQILRANKGRIDPIALCGDKAWIRWIVWKKLYDRKVKEVSGRITPQEGEPEINPVILKEIHLTKRFLFEKCEGQPTLEKIQEFATGPQMRTWMSSGKISKYYIVLSPWISKIMDTAKLESKFQFDTSLFSDKANEAVRALFKKEFAHEFSTQ